MNVITRIITGDLIDSLVYGSHILFCTGDGMLIDRVLQEIPEEPVSLRSVMTGRDVRIYSMEQFATDLCFSGGDLYYCNSDGVYRFGIYGPLRPAVKLWDARVQCLSACADGRIAMSAAGDGLFELYTDGRCVPATGRERAAKDIFRVTDRHSLFCEWSCGNLWNRSARGTGSLFAYRRTENGGRLCVQPVGEYGTEQIFGSTEDGRLISPAETKRNIYRFHDGVISAAAYGQPDGGAAVFEKETRVCAPGHTAGPADGFSHIRILLDGCAVNAFVLEEREGLTVVSEKGDTLYRTGPEDTAAGWRHFRYSGKDHVHVIFEDRMEIITFT